MSTLSESDFLVYSKFINRHFPTCLLCDDVKILLIGAPKGDNENLIIEYQCGHAARFSRKSLSITKTYAKKEVSNIEKIWVNEVRG